MANDNVLAGTPLRQMATNKQGNDDHVQQFQMVGPDRDWFHYLPLVAQAPLARVVGAASLEVLAANATRRGAIFTNTSANWIFLAVGVDAILDGGIALAPKGGTWSMGPFDYTRGSIRAIATGVGSKLAVQEFQ